MNIEGIESSIDSLDINEIVALRKLATKKIKKLRKEKTKKIQTFIPATKHFDLTKAQFWAFNNGLIQKNTLYGFSQFAILNTIDMIIKQISIEEQSKKLINDNMNTNKQPNIPQSNKYTNVAEPQTGESIDIV
uniref:Uncharacterized protein n=1 Tax=viral metagenome TaxID=1070528 RepID=A0A6M3LW67_9ZZZZ